jgi:general nucleoside transport system ATP-binding protein
MHIELRHIHKRFGERGNVVHANNDITLTFESGHIYGILGENGAGKSTLMKILSGYQPPDEGELLLDGKQVARFSPQTALANGVGMLQQDPLDIAAFTVLENFMYGGKPLSQKAARERLETLSRRFGFSLDPDRYIAELSIAQRQQLEIVRLLALDVRVLILDEPTTGISSEQKDLLFNALRELAKQDSMTVLLVSHKLEDVIALCHEVAVLRMGKVVGMRKMPATTADLVHLMFGAQVQVYQRERAALKDAAESLVLDRVTLQSPRLTVRDFTLKLRAGEIVGLAGLEGSGQELVLRACAGLVRPRQGAICVAGKKMTGCSYRQFMHQGVAFAPAGRIEEGLVAGLTLTEHMALAAENGMFIHWQAARKQTQAQIQRYQVRGKPESEIQTLSGGNQQRMLMGLMPEDAKALILEQPTRGLDVDSARWIWEQLLLRRKNGAAVLFSSAELDEILTYSDRVIVFFNGAATEFTDPEKVTVEALGSAIGGRR